MPYSSGAHAALDAAAVSPLFATLLFLLLLAAALCTASVLVKWAPPVARTLAVVEARRQTSIDGLRGCLGISVFIHHTILTWRSLNGTPWQTPPARLVLHLGQTSVALFFMITAFLFWSKVLASGEKMDWSAMLFARVYRLYPVYLLMFALVLAAVALMTFSAVPQPANSQVKPVLQWLLMWGTPDLNGLPNTSMLVAAVTWSLRYEWLFYLALPCLGFVLAATRQPRVATASALVVMIAIILCVRRDMFQLSHLQSFLGGILAAYWVRSPVLSARTRSPIAGVIALACLASVIVLMPTAFAWPATIGLGAFMIVVASGNDLWGMLRRPGLLWLGEITYGIYLLHGLLLWLVFQILLPRTLSLHAGVYAAAAAGTAIVLVLVCSIVFLTFERPAILIGRRHYRWLTRPAAVLHGSP
jgi:peptidoglycan/LPS O-acetylase OafA/YrhL